MAGIASLSRSFRGRLLRWHELDDAAAVAIGEDIEGAIRPLLHVADARVELGEQTLFANHPLALQHQTREVLARQRGDEQVILPCREQLAVVEADAAGRDIGRPEVRRLLHPGLRRSILVDRRAVVVVAVANHGEPVVLPFRNLVYLVAAARSVLAGPQATGARMECEALIVANAEREDLAARVWTSDERVVLRYRAVGIDPQHFAHEAIELLRLRPILGQNADAGRNR